MNFKIEIIQALIRNKKITARLLRVLQHKEFTLRMKLTHTKSPMLRAMARYYCGFLIVGFFPQLGEQKIWAIVAGFVICELPKKINLVGILAVQEGHQLSD